MQPESEQAAVVVSVRGAALREIRIGLALSLCFLVVLAASHPNWRGLGVFTLLQSAGASYVGIRAAWRFRGRLDEAVSLPTEAVEAIGRPTQRPLGRKRGLIVAAALIAAIGAVKLLGWKALGPDVVAAVVAIFITDWLVRPLATAYFAARWEREHGRARLFRPFVRDPDDGETLYVADRSVPAA